MNTTITLGEELLIACINAAGHIEPVFMVTYVNTVPNAMHIRHIRIIPTYGKPG